MRNLRFILIALVTAAAVFEAARFIDNAYVFFAGYVVLQYIVLAIAWNILGGYTGYVNFGTAAFFALGAYCSVVLQKTIPLPLPLMMLAGGVISGIVGLGMGYLTLRLRGTFFSIATLAMAVVAQTLITNWNFVSATARAAPTSSDRLTRRSSLATTSNICFWSCCCSRLSRCRLHAPSSTRGWGSGSPQSATTKPRRKRQACRPCGSS